MCGKISLRTFYMFTIALMFLVIGQGCISSSVRFTRSNNSSGMSQQVRKVSADWDYRSIYSIPCTRLNSVARSYLGVRYRFGGMSRKSTDCSGLVCMIYRDVSSAKMPRSTGKQRAIGNTVATSQAKCGDLVFFRGGVFGRINHVGIYLENGTFIHASVKRGVIISKLDEAYYRERYAETKRIFR